MKLLVKESKTPDEIVAQLNLATLCRSPTPAEREMAQKQLAQSPSPEYYEDLLWALINSKHFLFVH